MITIDTRSRKAVAIIKNMDKLTTRGVEYAAYTSGKSMVKATSADILHKPKGGRTYIRRDAAGRKRRHVASAAGETHANMSGQLRRALSFKVDPTQLEFGYGVQKGDAPEHAEYVEFGTKNMKARPSLQNGIKGERRNFMNNFEREIGKRLGARL